jgi:hypothetical protein
MAQSARHQADFADHRLWKQFAASAAVGEAPQWAACIRFCARPGIFVQTALKEHYLCKASASDGPTLQ